VKAADLRRKPRITKMNNTPVINIVGAGLAGCEAAWQAVSRGVGVKLYEMKPHKYTPAHTSPGFAELVCSNSLRSNMTTNAVGVLKEEMKLLGSLIMESALATEVPAGSALAVDRALFSEYITDKLKYHPLVEVIEGEVCDIPEGITVIATGPLTSEQLSESIAKLIGENYLHFYDAAAPIVSFDSIDMTKAFYASRYDKGEASYINCPMTKEEYERFYEALITAEVAELKEFDRNGQLAVFEGCMPIEVMAKRGHDTLLFGPMKPVGITVPSTGKEAYAIVQLRQENSIKSMYNIVGFQTHLKFPEQKRVFGLIPGLENAEFLRYGVMHRNTFMNSPKLLDSTYMLRQRSGLFFAGQMTGVEGYVESASSGLVAGINAARLALGLSAVTFDNTSVIGSLASYISDPNVSDFQPMNANFGLVAPLEYRVKGGKRARNEALAVRALEYIAEKVEKINRLDV
jgi:methylenetetrahydrofolate--tRNA-(uracil-5-)-methyltransferase